MRVRLFFEKPRLIFFLCYTLLFILAVRLAEYVLPFVIAMLFAVVLKPLYDYLRSRFRFRSTFTATALSLLIFGVLLTVIGFLLFLISRQGLSLIEEYRYLISDYIHSPELLTTLRDNLLSGNLLSAASSVVTTLFRAIPLSITFVVVTFAMTFFLLRHLGDMRDSLLRRAGEYRDVLHRVFHIAYSMVRRFIRSYLILYAITFVEAVFIFYLTGIEYPLAFAFITAVADILPILGPGSVYVPFAMTFILQKNYISGVTLLVYFLITVILRQILEPKIVSRSVKVNPLVVLSAIYFSIVSMNIWVLFYVVSIFMAFRVLNAAGVFEKKIVEQDSR